MSSSVDLGTDKSGHNNPERVNLNNSDKGSSSDVTKTFKMCPE